MAIKLRVNQAQALTYNEMDRNFSSFFYSASISTSGDHLELHYTGSTDLTFGGENYDPGRLVSIPLNPTAGQTPALSVAGTQDGHIQIKDGSALGFNSGFRLDPLTGHLGVGTVSPQSRVHVVGSSAYTATLRLQSRPPRAGEEGISNKSTVDFYKLTTLLGSIGKTNHEEDNLYINTSTTNSTLQFRVNGGTSALTSTGLGIGTALPQYALDIQGNGNFTGVLGVGETPNNYALNVYQNTTLPVTLGEKTDIASFGIMPGTANRNSLNIVAVRTTAGTDWTTSGMRIQNLVDNSYKAYIQFGGGGVGDENGISIGTGNVDVSAPFTNYLSDIPERLRITSVGKVGINTSTPTEQLTVQGNISGSGNLYIGTLAAGSAANTSALVATSTGQVQKIDAAPIPKGGIIMWSGAIVDIPAGWYLCNGSNGTPNLRDRFVVGAGSTYAVGDEGGFADAVVVEHNHTATSTDSGHTHTYILENTRGGGANGAEDGSSSFSTPNTSTGYAQITTTVNTAGVSGTNKNLPPYYALAYIMYGGI